MIDILDSNVQLAVDFRNSVVISFASITAYRGFIAIMIMTVTRVRTGVGKLSLIIFHFPIAITGRIQ